MTDKISDSGGSGPSQRAVEIGVATVTAAFAVVVIVGSLKAGINWGIEGPRAGFFPFYIGLIILASSIINLTRIALGERHRALFAEWGELQRVVALVVPAVIYVALIPVLGIYVCSAVLIALFMKVLGRYGWALTVAVSVLVPVVTYFLFEKWFLVPLPKGPMENLLDL